MSDTSSDINNIYDTGVERLHADSDFYSWKSLITYHLQRLNLWPIVSGALPRPPGPPAAARTAEQIAWDQGATEAKYFLYRHVDAATNTMLYAHDAAPAMWTALMSRFHTRDAASLMRSFRALAGLRHSEASGSLRDFLGAFEHAWSTLLGQTADAASLAAPGSLEASLARLVRSEDAKIEFLVSALPAPTRRMAFSLQVRRGSEMRYADLWRLLSELHVLQEMDDAEEAMAMAERMDCSWCRSRGLESVGHHWRACERLKEFKREEGREGAKERKGRKQRRRGLV